MTLQAASSSDLPACLAFTAGESLAVRAEKSLGVIFHFAAASTLLTCLYFAAASFLG